jgi:hypothetical protein
MFETNWRDGMQDVALSIDETMGELVTVTPVDQAASKPNFPNVMLPGQAVQVVAVFTSPARTVSLTPKSDRGHGQMPGQAIVTSEPAFSFRYGVLPFAAHQGMRITTCRTGETFEVKAALPDGVSRIVCTVIQLGRQSELR